VPVTRANSTVEKCREIANRSFHKRYAENPQPFIDAAKKKARTIRGRFWSLRGVARKTGRQLEISFEQYQALVSMPCHYCGAPLSATGYGLDRLDNRFGYTLGNVAPCCWDCNSRKGHLEQIGFIYPRTTELLLELISTEKK